MLFNCLYMRPGHARNDVTHNSVYAYALYSEGHNM